MFSAFRGHLNAKIAVLSGWPRKLLALGCLLLAAMSALNKDEPGRATTLTVLVAAHALKSGAILAEGDVRLAQWPASTIPATALTTPRDLVGESIGGPMAAGEPFTKARLLDTAITAGLAPGQVAVTIRLAVRASGGFVQPGSVVDLYAPPPEGVLVDGQLARKPGRAVSIAQRVRVLAVLPGDDHLTSDQTTVVVATNHDTALRVANLPSTPFLATLWPPS